MIRTAVLIVLGLVLAAGRAIAQGGPPMITDDPGTPGNGHWEVNLAWTDERVPGATEYGLPLLDANYGVGDRIQLNYQASWNILRADGGSAADGMSDSQFAVKWRFWDEGDKNWQVSMYPRIFLRNPGSSADERGVADPATTFLMPFEITREFDGIEVNVDFGRQFSTRQDDRGWTGGLCLGKVVREGVEVMAEVHEITSQPHGGGEITVNLGARVDLSKKTTLLLALGRDMENSFGPRISLLSYLGVQFRR